tara:strand:+ start:2947 stop:6174 length:3228 start_codon:yes stop_codon:yes gene_type:complete
MNIFKRIKIIKILKNLKLNLLIPVLIIKYIKFHKIPTNFANHQIIKSLILRDKKFIFLKRKIIWITTQFIKLNFILNSEIVRYLANLSLNLYLLFEEYNNAFKFLNLLDNKIKNKISIFSILQLYRSVNLDKDKFEYILTLKGLGNKILFIVDELNFLISNKIYYSQLNNEKEADIRGIFFNQLDSISYEYISQNFEEVSIHLNNNLLDGLKKKDDFLSLIKSLHKNLLINIYYDDLCISKEEIRKFILNLSLYINNIFVYSDYIQGELIKFLPTKAKSKIKLKELIDFKNIISKSYKPKFIINKKEVQKDKNYVLYITSLSSENIKQFLSKLIYNIKKSKDTKLLIVFKPNGSSIKYILSILRFLFRYRNEENILIIFQTWNELIGEVHFIDFLKNINNIVINDLEVNHIDYLSITKDINIKIFINKKYEKQFKLLKFNNFEYLKNGNNKYLEDKDNKLKTFKKPILDKLIDIPNKKELSQKVKFKYNFILYRIIGNDMPPLQGEGQLIKNLKFIVEHEKLKEDYKRVWILNRIHDSQKLNKIKTFLDEQNEEYKEIDFIYSEFISQKLNINKNILLLLNNHFWYEADETKINLFVLLLKNFNNYATNINQARNFCFKDGNIQNCKWVFPLDGNIFIPDKNLLKISDQLNSTDKNYLIMPMKRIDNISDIANINDKDFSEEAQVGFRLDKNIYFDENYCYGFRPKVNLLKRLMIFDKYNIFRNTKYDYLLNFKLIESTPIDYEWSEGVLRLPYYEKVINKKGAKRTLSIYKLLNQIFSKYSNKYYKKISLNKLYINQKFKQIRTKDNFSIDDQLTKYIIDYIVVDNDEKKALLEKKILKNLYATDHTNLPFSEISLYVNLLNIKIMEENIGNYDKKIISKLKEELKNNINYLLFKSKQYDLSTDEINVFNRIYISNIYKIINENKSKLLDNFMLLFINLNYYTKKYFSNQNYLNNYKLLKSLRTILNINYIFINELNLNIIDNFPLCEGNNFQQIILDLVYSLNNKAITSNESNEKMIRSIINISLSQSHFLRDHYKAGIKNLFKIEHQLEISDLVQIYSLYPKDLDISKKVTL